MLTERVLTIDDLSVRYGRRQILEGVRLDLDRGEVLALLGRNGEGKTSLVRCLLGLQRPQSGRIEVFGRDAWSRREEILADVAYVPERPQAPEWCTARQLLAWGGAFYPRWEEGPALAALEANRVPLDLALGSLSQGQRKQVEIAFALASRPRLLILDDPALGLDPVARRHLWDQVIERLADEGVSILLTTHELEAVERVAERVAVLHGGRLVVDEPLESLRSRFRRLPAAAETPSVRAAGTVATAWGERRVVTDWPGDGLADALAARAEPMSLEEIFEALIRETPS
jgi:ABC-2 type transport system ATP-binding protein